MRFQTDDFNVQSGVPFAVDLDCTCFIIEEAQGDLIVGTDQNSEFRALAGRVYISPAGEPGKITTIRSTLSETIRVTYGLGAILFQESWGGSGGGLGNKVQGILAEGQYPNANIPNPVIDGMVRDNGDGTTNVFPLSTIDGHQLLVQLGFKFSPGFAVQTGINIDTRGFETVRISVVAGGGGPGPLRFFDQYGVQLPIYPGDGSAVVMSLPAPSTTIGYYIPCTGVTALQSDSSGAGVWQFRFTGSVLPWTPRLG